MLTLSESETTYFQAFVKSSNNMARHKSKIISLFEDIYQNRLKASTDIRKNRKNLEILESRILDSLLTDNSLTRDGKYSNNPNKDLVIYKEALKLRLLTKRGNSKRVFDLAQSLIAQSTYYEKYDISISLIRQQLSLLSAYSDAQLYRQKIEELDKLEYTASLYNRSIQYLHEIRLRKHLGVQENFDLFLENVYNKISSFSRKSSSPTIAFISTFLLKEIHQYRGQATQALANCIELYHQFETLPNNDAVTNIYDIIIEHAIICHELSQVNLGQFFLEKIISAKTSSQLTYLNSLYLLLISYYLGHNFDKALQTLNIYKQYQNRSDLGNLPSEYHNRLVYAEACIQFNSKKYSSCLKTLSTHDFGRKDPTVVKLKYRFLQLAALIESQKFDLADNHLEALRKFLDRNSIHGTFEMEYYQPIYETMTELRKNGYDFKKLIHFTPSGEQRLVFAPVSPSFDLAFLNEWLQGKFTDALENQHYFLLYDDRINNYYSTGYIKPAYQYN